MRISFNCISRPKSAAKLLARLSSRVTLSAAQNTFARASGYRDWHELDASIRQNNSVPVQPNALQGKQLVLSIAGNLGLREGDVQYALSRGLGAWLLADQLRIRSMILRETAFGAPARGKSGTVVKVKERGAVRPAYLRFAGRPSSVLYDNGTGLCADFEVVTPRMPLPDFVPSRIWLPYGYWTTSDGSEVVFARDYLPMWKVSNGLIERLDPWVWIDRIQTETHFSTLCDTVAWSDGPARDLAISFLKDRRIVGLPRLADVLPYMLRPEIETPREAAEQLRRELS